MFQPRARAVIFIATAVLLVSTTCLAPAEATPPTNLTNGQSLYPGQYLSSPNGAFHTVFDNGGHVILIRQSDGRHCASWPSPTSVHASAHATYSTASQLLLLTSNNSVYATVNGDPLLGGTTVNVTNTGHLWVGNKDVHGC